MQTCLNHYNPLKTQWISCTHKQKHKSRTQESVPPVCDEEWSPGPTETAELGQENGRMSRKWGVQRKRVQEQGSDAETRW